MTFDVPGALGTALFDINNNGDLAGSYLDAFGTQHGFVYINGEVITIDYTGLNTNLWGINDLRQAVGGVLPQRRFLHGAV